MEAEPVLDLGAVRWPGVEVMKMRKCGICRDFVSEQDMEGNVCWVCMERSDETSALSCAE